MPAEELACDGAPCLQTMVAMRDGVRLNTFVFLPREGGPRWPVIMQRTPYGITAADARDKWTASCAQCTGIHRAYPGRLPPLASTR
jgi:predicted acyl esterase